MASTIPPYDFEPVSSNSKWSITESTESDTESEFINTDTLLMIHDALAKGPYTLYQTGKIVIWILVL